MVDFLYLPDVKIDQADWVKVRRQQPAFAALLEAAQAGFAGCEWDAPGIRDATLAAGATVGVSALGKAQAPVRLAVTGRTVGPPLFESLVLLGRRRTIARLAAARDRAVQEDQAQGPQGR
jgi:glutamyl-tRNA synthetase